MKNKGFWILIIPYTILLLLDIWSTLRLKELAPILETNILFKFLGFPGLIILNILVIIFFWWAYTKKTGPTLRYLLIITLFFFSLTRIIIIDNNLSWDPGEITIEQAKRLATPEAKLETQKEILKIYYPPLIFTFIPFLIWKLDHDTKIKDSN